MHDKFFIKLNRVSGYTSAPPPTYYYTHHTHQFKMIFAPLDMRITAYKSKLMAMLPVYVNEYYFLVADDATNIGVIAKDVHDSSVEGDIVDATRWTAREILIQNAENFLTRREQGVLPENTPTPDWAVYASHPRGFEGLSNELDIWFVDMWLDKIKEEAANENPVEPMD